MKIDIRLKPTIPVESKPTGLYRILTFSMMALCAASWLLCLWMFLDRNGRLDDFIQSRQSLEKEIAGIRKANELKRIKIEDSINNYGIVEDVNKLLLFSASDFKDLTGMIRSTAESGRSCIAAITLNRSSNSNELCLMDMSLNCSDLESLDRVYRNLIGLERVDASGSSLNRIDFLDKNSNKGNLKADCSFLLTAPVFEKRGVEDAAK